jgi:phytoene synthase
MQIAGQRMDAHFHDIRSIEELVQYARLVAGSVGRVLVPILVSDMGIIDNPDFMKSCEALGVGMQITNILRDVGEDIRERDRVYVPVELMRSHAITRVQLMQWSVAATDEVSTAKYRGLFLGGDKEYGDADPVAASPEIPQNFIDLWEELAAMADSYYLPYEAWISAFHHSARLPLVSAARLYQAIEQAVRDQHYDCFTQRCYTSAPIRSAIVQSVTQDLGRLLP